MTTGTSDEDNKSVFKGEMSNPAGRPGKDTDMAATVLFLAGPGGVFYNEQVSDSTSIFGQRILTAIVGIISGWWKHTFTAFSPGLIKIHNVYVQATEESFSY